MCRDRRRHPLPHQPRPQIGEKRARGGCVTHGGDAADDGLKGAARHGTIGKLAGRDHATGVDRSRSANTPVKQAFSTISLEGTQAKIKGFAPTGSECRHCELSPGGVPWLGRKRWTGVVSPGRLPL